MAEDNGTNDQAHFQGINATIIVTIILIGVATILIINQQTALPAPGVGASQPVIATVSSVEPGIKPSSVSYQGETGKTALELLPEYAQVETQGEGENAFVVGINGYKPDIKKEFWAFYVNGKQAEVGAGSYVTQDSDIIEWRLEDIKTP